MVQKKVIASDQWAFLIVLSVLLPFFCVLLGFWVAVVRPRDPLSWLLLALLLGFSQLFILGTENQDGTLASNLALAYRQLFTNTLFIWIFLMGLYFPSQIPSERRVPWLKWFLIVPLVVPLAFGSLVETIIFEAQINDYSVAARLAPLYFPVNKLQAILSLAAIVLFFAAIVAKYVLASTPDAKRRLRLLYVGTFLALTPTATLVVIGAFTGKALDDFPPWIELPCLLLTSLFPLTLAYLIVIHKALDVSVVIRQGVQYALARGGVTILQILLTAVLVITISLVAGAHRVHLPQMIVIISVGIAVVFLVRRVGLHLATWVDRRFFREAYNSELLLAELSDKVRTIVQIRPLLETVANRISESLHVRQLAVLIDGTGPYQPLYVLGYDNAPDVVFPENGATVRRLREEKEPARVYFDDPRSWIYSTPDVTNEERSCLTALRSELLLPLAAKDKLLGFVSLGQKRSEEPYSGTDLRLLKSVAAQTGLALENARLTAAIAEEVAQRERLNRELEIAREVQERLFPQKLPAVPGLDYCGACRPAQSVGGDYYDFIEFSNGSLGLAIGDISGKGISAALMMANLQALLRSQTLNTHDDLAGIVSRINRLVYQASSSDRYATFFFAQYNPTARTLSYVNAGHNPPMLFRACQGRTQIDRLDVGGLVIGLLGNSSYQDAALTLRAGDLLVAFTDGITEATSPSGEEWGEENLIKTVQDCQEPRAGEILDRIMRAVDAFAAGTKQHDDMTLIVIKASA